MTARAELGQGDFTAEWTAGSAMALDDAVAFALAEPLAAPDETTANRGQAFDEQL